MLDLRGLTFMDSTGLRLVIRWDTVAARSGFRLRGRARARGGPARLPPHGDGRAPHDRRSAGGRLSARLVSIRTPTAWRPDPMRGTGSSLWRRSTSKRACRWAARRVASAPAGRGRAERTRSRTRLADVALLVTELVANGVRHGGADESSAVDVPLRGSRDRAPRRGRQPGPRRRGGRPARARHGRWRRSGAAHRRPPREPLGGHRRALHDGLVRARLPAGELL